jgi:hypothetical protein
VLRESCPVFRFCVPGLVFDGTEGVVSRFNVLRARTHFPRYRGRRLPFSRFALPYSFSAVPRASRPVIKFCARTNFRRYRGRRLPFSSFARPDSFSAVPRASGPIFKFCAPGLVFGGTNGVGTRFLILRARTHFGGTEGVGPHFHVLRVGLVFDGTEDVSTRFHVLRARNSFRRYRGSRVPFSCFSCPDSFSTVLRASGPVFLICAPELVFSGTEGVVSRIHFLRAHTWFWRYQGRRHPFSCFALPDSVSTILRASCLVFMYCVLGLVFGGTEGVWSRFHVLCARTRFWRWVPFACFVRPESFTAVPRTSGPVFMFCVAELVLLGTEGVVSRFHVLRARTRLTAY